MVARRKTNFWGKLKEIFPVANNYAGEVGIEIEVEGQNLPLAIGSYWTVTRDGSLRGESAEYVLTKPIKRDNVKPYLTYLAKQMKDTGAVLKMSTRTSVHVHVNMNNRSLVQCYTFMTLYLIFEDLLTEYAGPARRGNVFCLRASDAEAFVTELCNYARKQLWNPDPDMFRYTALNVCAIQKFNSIEFRALRGTMEVDVIQTWVNILLALKDAAAEFDNPQEIIQGFSMGGAEGFINRVLPEHAHIFKRMDNWRDRMLENMRLAQEIAYATDWKEPENKKLGRMFPVEDGQPKPMLENWQADINEHEDEDED